MTINQKLILIIIVLLINTLLAASYLIAGILITESREDKKLRKYILLSLFVFLCPVAAPVMLGFGTLLYHVFFDSKIDLAAITFSKERVDILERPDVEAEINLIPMEEAIIIDDKENLRQLLLTVLRGDVSKSINTITKALNSSDSEASHYAASAIMDIKSEFQTTLQKFQTQLEAAPDDRELNQLLMEYMIKMLSTNFLSDLELKTYVYALEQICQTIYDKDKAALKVLYYSSLINLLVRIGDMHLAADWISRIQEEYPDDIEAYRCILRFYYMRQDKEHFFHYMERLKKSEIAIDKDLLELIRIYS